MWKWNTFFPVVREPVQTVRSYVFLCLQRSTWVRQSWEYDISACVCSVSTPVIIHDTKCKILTRPCHMRLRRCMRDSCTLGQPRIPALEQFHCFCLLLVSQELAEPPYWTVTHRDGGCLITWHAAFDVSVRNLWFFPKLCALFSACLGWENYSQAYGNKHEYKHDFGKR